MEDSPTRDALAKRRISEFKTPHSRKDSQETRRERALEAQKKKRAARIESSRNIDLFANLSISSPRSHPNELSNVDDDDDDDPIIPNEGLSQFVSMLEPTPRNQSSITPTELPTSFGSTSHIHSGRKASRSKAKRNRPGPSKDPVPQEPRFNPLANAIMYAELLEMNPEMIQWSQGMEGVEDGLPKDLTTGWVALAPIPQGKRCMAVSYQILSGGNDEPRSKTQLHSRVKGTPFLTFPSSLPPDTILDCILDSSWQQNGLLHVVDILRWRGSDFMDCETEFRFWWRDARLSELPELPVPPCPPPKASKSSDSPPPSNTIPVLFGYPTKFLPVPYYSSPLSFQILLQSVIPAARTPRTLTIRVPIPFSKPPRRRFKDPSSSNGPMEIDETSDLSQTSSDPTAMDNFGRSSRDVMSEYHSHPQKLSSPKRQTKEEIVSFQTDGLLLYVSQASYQSGESPLTCWVPALPYNEVAPEHAQTAGPSMSVLPPNVTALDLFERLVQQQYIAQSPATSVQTQDTGAIDSMES